MTPTQQTPSEGGEAICETVTLRKSEFDNLLYWMDRSDSNGDLPDAVSEAWAAIVTIDCAKQAVAAVPSGQQLVRFCPHCGLIGEPGEQYRDCCPDGNGAYMVPRKFAEQCRVTFRLCLETVAAPTAPSNDHQRAEAEAKVYAECRECSHCGHVGINDADKQKAACHNCDWSGPSPTEDHCPGCADTGTMGAACPKCGAIYKLLAEADITAPAAPASLAQGNAVRDVIAERQRQMQVEGWTPEHDDEHGNCDMAEAAACYITGRMEWSIRDSHQRWPWSMTDWKPKDRRRNLVRAGALLLAEIERLDRAALKLALKRTTAADPEGKE